jgi:hypothetical protein
VDLADMIRKLGMNEAEGLNHVHIFGESSM